MLATAVYKSGLLAMELSKKLERKGKARSLQTKGRLLPKLFRALCELGGWGWFIYAGFTVNTLVGSITAGVACLILQHTLFSDNKESTDIDMQDRGMRR